MKMLYRFLLMVSIIALSACNASSVRTPAKAAIPTPSLAMRAATNTPTAVSQLTPARQKIKLMVIIVQENRSFDQYFGTFPGADGIPMHNVDRPYV